MMKKWKYTFKHMILLGLTVLLFGGGADRMALSVLARESSEGDRGGFVYAGSAQRLTANEKLVYDGVKAAARQIASGQRESAKITVSGFTSLANSQEEITDLLDRVLERLLEEAPEDFYWYDGENGGYEGEWLNESPVRSITISLAVAPEFQSGDLYTADTAKTTAAGPAFDRAWSIIAKYQSRTDVQKLKGYLTEICALVSREEEDTESRAAEKEALWPLIRVFDGDRSTNVGSEGYAAAFQYLCDGSDFENAICYTVEGEVYGAIKERDHDWNLVFLEGNSYLVDVMNCDTGAVGAPDQLFLAGGEGSIRNGYTISLNKGSDSATYDYYTTQYGVPGDALALSPYSYLAPEEVRITVTPPSAEVTFGNPVSDQALNGGSAVNQRGELVPGVFTWDPQVTFYGNAGTNTLKAVFTPDNPQYAPVEDIEVSVKVNRRPVTVTAEAKSKLYGQPDPGFSYTYSNVIEGYLLKGELSRAPGENAGTYEILQGSLTEASNPNYAIDFTGSTLEIRMADYAEQVNRNQSIWPGVGDFAEPVFTDGNGQAVQGSLIYGCNGRTGLNYEGVRAELAKLPADSKGVITYTFTPGQNYNPKSGQIDFTMKRLTFLVGNDLATAANAVTVKSDAAYGDSWADIVQIGSITAKADTGSDSDPRHFTLDQTGTPEVGAGQSFQVLYSGTVDGQTFTNQVVCSGTVDVKKRVITVSEGSYKVTKTYDKTRTGGTASGELELHNVLEADAGRVSVTAVPEGYSDPNVNGQERMAVKLSLSGAGADRYELSGVTLEVPCEITPKEISPIVKVSGNYSYTGRAVMPAVTVSQGTEVIAASDYQLALSNNRNAGTGKVTVRPRSGSNYTWSSAVEATFTIDKAEYKGAKTGSSSMEYGGSAVFSMFSMLPEGYKLGEIRVSDPDEIIAEKPVVNGTVLTCKLANDKSKEGKTAEITVPVKESTNYFAYDLTFTVKMAAQRSESQTNTPAAPSGEAGGNDSSAGSSNSDVSLPGGTPSATVREPEESGASGSASVTAMERQNSKSGRTGGIGMGPVVWCLIGMALSAGVIGGAYFVRRKVRSGEVD